jgi:WD40 repeat protein
MCAKSALKDGPMGYRSIASRYLLVGLLLLIAMASLSSSFNVTAQGTGLSYHEILRVWSANGQPQIWKPNSGPAPTNVPDESYYSSHYEYKEVALYSFAWEADSNHLITADEGNVRIWDIQTGQSTLLEGINADWIAPSPDGKWFAIRSGESLKIWNHKTLTVQQDCGNFKSISNVNWSPDSQIVTAVKVGGNSAEHAIIFCKLGSDETSKIAPTYYPFYLAYSPDGKKLAAISYAHDTNNYFRFYDVATNQLDATMAVPYDAYAVVWSPDSQHVATSWNSIQIRDAKTYLPQVTIEQASTVLAWHPHGNRLITYGKSDGNLVIYNTINGAQLATIPDVAVDTRSYAGAGNPDAVQWSPDGSKFAVRTREGVIRIYVEQGVQPASTPFPPTPTLSVPKPIIKPSPIPPSTLNPAKLHEIAQTTGKFNPYIWASDGRPLLIVQESIVQGGVWELYRFNDKAENSLITRVTNPVAWAISPDGNQLAIAASLIDTRGTPNRNEKADANIMQLLSLEQPPSLSEIPDNNVVRSISWSPDGKWIAVLGKDGRVSLWHVGLKRRIFSTIDEDNYGAKLIWSPDGRAFANTNSGNVYFIDPVNLKNVQRWTLPTANNVTWSPDGTKIAATTDAGIVRVWDVTTQRLISTIRGFYSTVTLIEWSPDNRMLAAFSDDYALGVHPDLIVADAATGRAIAHLTNVIGLGVRMKWITPSKLLIAESEGAKISVFDTQTGQTHIVKDGDELMYAAVTADGQWLAYSYNTMPETGARDSNVEIVDLTTEKTVAVLPFTSSTTELSWSPDSHQLAIVFEDNTVILWSDR